MEELARIREVKARAEARLLAIPGVHAVGIGGKQVGGKPTGEPAILIFLEQKRPLSELLAEHVIPSEIEGIKTDVIEAAPPVQFAGDQGKHRPLVAGYQLQPGGGLGGFGTLGVLAQTLEPTPRIIATTCQHVVATPPAVIPSDLHFSGTATFVGPNTPDSLVEMRIIVRPGPGLSSYNSDFFYVTAASDTPNTIATALAANITSAGDASITATATGPTVNVAGVGAATVSVITSIFGAVPRNSDSSVNATIHRDDTDAGKFYIDLQGVASRDCGAYITINTGGLGASNGAFAQIPAGSTPPAAATAIGNAITARALAGVTATVVQSRVTVQSAEEVACHFTGDTRVGQNTNSFCSDCCQCCTDRIGKVVDSRLEVDTAMIQLDPGIQYKAEILNLGVVKGTHTADIDDVLHSLPVFKCGRTTGLTNGALTAMDVSGSIGSSVEGGRFFARFYTGALLVTNVTPVSTDPTVTQFSDLGDSGSAVVNAQTEVIGLLFGGSATTTLVTPIDAVTSAFNLQVLTATALNVVQTVPTLAHAVARQRLGDNSAAQGGVAGALERRLRQAESEIAATEDGQVLADVVRRNAPEAIELTNTNKRVAAVWRRNGGPEIAHAMLGLLQAKESRLPDEIEGRQVRVSLARIEAIFLRYASASFASDLKEFAPRVKAMLQLSYREVLESLDARSVAMAHAGGGE